MAKVEIRLRFRKSWAAAATPGYRGKVVPRKAAV
jgi:hypothetical protein